MNTEVKLTPFSVIPTPQSLDEVYGGDLAIGESLEKWVSGEITAEEIAEEAVKNGHAFLPFVAISLNGWTALRRLQTSLIGIHQAEDFEASARYTCPYTKMEPWALVPLGILATNASIYKKAFTDPGAWAYVFEMVTEEGREKHLPYQVGEYNEPLEAVLSSVTIAMLGSGFTDMCSSDDGDNKRKLVTVDLNNGDKVVCVAWVWYNK